MYKPHTCFDKNQAETLSYTTILIFSSSEAVKITLTVLLSELFSVEVHLHGVRPTLMEDFDYVFL